MEAASASAAYPPSMWNCSSSRPYFFIAAADTAASSLAMSSVDCCIPSTIDPSPRASRMRVRARSSRLPERGSCGR